MNKKTLIYTKAENGCIIKHESGECFVFSLDSEAAKHIGAVVLADLSENKTITINYEEEDK
jgi:hypothetical protein